MRTEQEIIKDFEKLGYEVIVSNNSYLTLEINECLIKIKKYNKTYECYWEDRYSSSCYFDMQEHKLLHELFECWGWL